MVRLGGQKPGSFKPQAKKGFTLIESLVALAVLGIIVVAFMGSMVNANKALIWTDEQQTAISIAKAQLEYIKQSSYASSYDAETLPSEYAGYSVSIIVAEITGGDSNLQKIRIIVSHQGNPVIISNGSTLEGYKVR